MRGLPGPTPWGTFPGATRPRTPGYFLLVQKVPKNTPKPRFWIPLSYLVFIRFGTSPNRIRFCHLIYSGSIGDASAAALLKRYMFLGVLIEAWFLYRNHGSIQRITGQVEVLRGNPKGGGRPLLCRRGGGVHRGGTPSKGSHPYACFWLLFARAKSDPGPGREGPGGTE